jgi:1-acyl-sn-glycerol-3-phosphate acyltransferase
MNIDSESWVIEQRDIFRSRRDFFRKVIFDGFALKCLWDLTVTGLENIPATDPAIIMMNHLAAIDPIVAIGSVRPRYVVPMSKIENFQHPLVGIIARTWGAYPVRRGEIDREALKIAMKLMEAGEITLIAPEGHRNTGLQRPHDGLAYIATRAADPVIIPTAVFNHETWLKDMFIPWRRTPVHVSFGPGFRIRTEGRRRIPREELHQMTDEMMYQLALLLPERNRGEYADLSRMTTRYLEFVNPPAAPEMG